MKRWPDGTPKSTGHAFDWRNQPNERKLTVAEKVAQARAREMAQGKMNGKPITIGSQKK